MSVIGRNQPCPCGSGKKYKRCHGAYAVAVGAFDTDAHRAAAEQSLRSVKALNARREKQQGLGSPIVAAKMHNGQMVAVGKRVHFSAQWKTFHDFLRDHLFGLLGKDWMEAELATPVERRHRILQWFDQATQATLSAGTKVGEVYG